MAGPCLRRALSSPPNQARLSGYVVTAPNYIRSSEPWPTTALIRKTLQLSKHSIMQAMQHKGSHADTATCCPLFYLRRAPPPTARRNRKGARTLPAGFCIQLLRISPPPFVRERRREQFMDQLAPLVLAFTNCTRSTVGVDQFQSVSMGARYEVAVDRTRRVNN